MKFCYFGNFNPSYSRNSVNINGLRQNNCQVILCQTRKRGIWKYIDLFLKHYKIKHQYDFLIVGFSGFSLLWLAKLLSKKPLIFDAFVSQYLSNIEDRRQHKPNSLKARYYKFLDKFACQLADIIFIDTKAQTKYFIENYNLNPSKFFRIQVGSDDNIFNPNLKPKTSKLQSKFIVHWHGYMVPFHGFDIIIKAASIIAVKDADIKFQLITEINKNCTQSNKDKLKKLNNIDIIGKVDYPVLAAKINRAHICLGIFSNSTKAKLVIPNKIIEAAACRKPAITANHQVVNEIFTDNKNIVLCSPENPTDLADKIIELKNNNKLRKKIATNAHQLYVDKLSPKKIGEQITKTINLYINN